MLLVCSENVDLFVLFHSFSSLVFIDEFNEKLLNPDLNSEQLNELQVTGQKLFEIFFSRNSPDRIPFKEDSENQLKTFVYGNIENIVLLRTSPTLFEAYEHVMDVLENHILVRFYRSSEVTSKKKLCLNCSILNILCLSSSIT